MNTFLDNLVTLPVFDKSIFGNSLPNWFVAFLLTISTYLLVRSILPRLARRLQLIAERTSTSLDNRLVEVIDRTSRLFTAVLAVFIGSLVLSLPVKLEQGIGVALMLAVVLQVAVWTSFLARQLLEFYFRPKSDDDPGSLTALGLLTFLARVLIWSAALLVILDNLGINITTLIAGLGVGGIAVALAVQNILGDLFASLSIVLDKPFKVGDFVIVGDFLGSVERIGIKTTRIRSLWGEQLIFSNSDLLASRIKNYKQMKERRVCFKIGVVYSSAYEHVEQIPKMVKQIIEDQEQTRFDRAHFSLFGDFSLIFEIVYYVLGADYNLYMDIQQAINLRILKAFRENNIEFAFPTQTLHIEAKSP
jgi:small-conductance mechanosensitive channel